jgi:hypothetical protein
MKNKKRTLRVFSRHPSHESLRQSAVKLPVLTCIRLGSTTVGTLPYKVEINSIDSIKNSSNKLLMKRCFQSANIKTAEWIEPNTIEDIHDFFEEHQKIISKSLYGSRGIGNTLLSSHEEIKNYFHGKNLKNYIIEAFKNYTKEYRLHVTSEGCFYACRKMLKSDTPQDKRWYRNDSNCNWILESNELFCIPSNWKEVEHQCVLALKSVGLDVGAVDLKIQSEKDGKRDNPDFCVIEINSAASFGEETLKHYINIIPKIVENKLK